jgi:hypothetical protein
VQHLLEVSPLFGDGWSKFVTGTHRQSVVGVIEALKKRVIETRHRKHEGELWKFWDDKGPAFGEVTTKPSKIKVVTLRIVLGFLAGGPEGEGE